MTVCVFVPSPSVYLGAPVGDRSALERFISFIREVPDVSRVVALAEHPVAGVPDQWTWRTRDAWSAASLLETIAGEVSGPDDIILFTFVDQPFLNLELTRRLIDRHERYRADYTFADGYPVGLAPEVLRGRALAYLRELAAAMKGPVSRSSLFEVIQKDMNRFDIETELSRTDQRLLRLTIAVDTKANLEVCRSLAVDAPAAIDEWPAHVDARKASHRSLPRYVSVQVLEQEVQELSYSPYPGMRRSVREPGEVMEAGTFSRIVDEIAALSPEAVVSISHWGEVSLHPEVMTLVDAVLAHGSLGLIVETSGIGWAAATRDELFSRERVVVITGLDSDDEDVYRKVRGDGFAEAVAFARASVEALPERAYLQAVRCDHTEPSLDAFYRKWSALTENVIIQKFDWFSGRLPQRRLGDIAPLKRFPCWHLQRDLTVLVDGNVPLCREDLESECSVGNVLTDGVEAAWMKGNAEYAKHVQGSFNGICERCDEYYTFNF